MWRGGSPSSIQTLSRGCCRRTLEHRAEKWVPVFSFSRCDNKDLEQAGRFRFRTACSSAGARILQAGRIALHRRQELLAAGESFAIETTLTGRSELDLMRAARRAGFKVSLVYIGLRDVQNSIARVRERVSRGGHDVPFADLIRRFDRSLGHLREAMAIADRVVLIDNSRARRQLVLSRESGRIKYAMSEPPAWANLDVGA